MVFSSFHGASSSKRDRGAIWQTMLEQKKPHDSAEVVLIYLQSKETEGRGIHPSFNFSPFWLAFRVYPEFMYGLYAAYGTGAVDVPQGSYSRVYKIALLCSYLNLQVFVSYLQNSMKLQLPKKTY